MAQRQKQGQQQRQQPKQSQPQSQSRPEDPSYFNLFVDGVGYLNRVRTVEPKGKRTETFLACSISALRGSTNAAQYTKFDCRVSGKQAKEAVELLEPDVTAEKRVIVGFRIADIYTDLFTYKEGERKGQPGVTIKGRLLRLKFAKVDGESATLPGSEEETEGAAS
jgi:hypothetical protein